MAATDRFPEVDAWLAQPAPQNRDKTRLTHFADLVGAADGDNNLGIAGVVSYCGGPFGREGLTVEEYTELSELQAFTCGVELVDPEAARYLVRRIKSEKERIGAAFQEEPAA